MDIVAGSMVNVGNGWVGQSVVQVVEERVDGCVLTWMHGQLDGYVDGSVCGSVVGCL